MSAKFQCNFLLTSVSFSVDPSLSLLIPLFSSQPTFQGPKTQALFYLQVRVGELPQLRQSKHRFNAFLLGLLKWVLAANPLWSPLVAWKVLKSVVTYYNLFFDFLAHVLFVSSVFLFFFLLLVPSFLMSGCLTFSLAVVSFHHYSHLIVVGMHVPNSDLSSSQMCWRHITTPPPSCVCRWAPASLCSRSCSSCCSLSACWPSTLTCSSSTTI